LVVDGQVIDALHRATVPAVGIYRVQILPVVPDLVDHLSSSATSVPSPSTNPSVATYGMMQEEYRICRRYQHQRKEKDICLYENVPFDDHVGPSVQADPALAGHSPAISLEAAKGEMCQKR
jgi:hypothetical protein